MNKELKNKPDFTLNVTQETFQYKSIHVTEAASPLSMSVFYQGIFVVIEVSGGICLLPAASTVFGMKRIF